MRNARAGCAAAGVIFAARGPGSAGVRIGARRSGGVVRGSGSGGGEINLGRSFRGDDKTREGGGGNTSHSEGKIVDGEKFKHWCLRGRFPTFFYRLSRRRSIAS